MSLILCRTSSTPDKCSTGVARREIAPQNPLLKPYISLRQQRVAARADISLTPRPHRLHVGRKDGRGEDKRGARARGDAEKRGAK